MASLGERASQALRFDDLEGRYGKRNAADEEFSDDDS